MQLQTFLAELNEIESARSVLKNRAMIYDVAAKEAAAKRDGLSADAYYRLPYDRWMAVR